MAGEYLIDGLAECSDGASLAPGQRRDNTRVADLGELAFGLAGISGSTRYITSLPTREMEQYLFRALFGCQSPNGEVAHSTPEESVQKIATDPEFNRLIFEEKNARYHDYWRAILTASETLEEVLLLAFSPIAVVRMGYWPGVSAELKIAGGLNGLRQALHRFDPDVGVRFSNFAGNYALRGIQRAICDELGIHTVALRNADVAQRLALVFSQEFGRRPTRDELRAQLIANADGKDGRPKVSVASVEQTLDIYEMSQEVQNRPLPESLRDPTHVGHNTFELGTAGDHSVRIGSALAMLSRLPEDYQVVIRARLGLEGARSYPDIVAEIGVNRAEMVFTSGVQQLRGMLLDNKSGEEALQVEKVSDVDAAAAWFREESVRVKALDELVFRRLIGDSSLSQLERVLLGMLRDLSLGQIGRMVGRSRQRIAQIKNDLPDALVRAHKQTMAEKRERLDHRIVSLIQQGYTREQIVDKARVSASRIDITRAAMRRLGMIASLPQRESFVSSATRQVQAALSRRA